MAEGRRRVGSLWFVVGVLVAVPATIFALSNLDTATIQFLGWQAETPLWAVIIISVLAGVLIGSALTAALGARRRRGKQRKASSRAAAQERPATDPAAAGPDAAPDLPG
jgi:uncharacterized integral membrane protein